MGQVRNVCLVGHSGSGKTALAAAVLRQSGSEVKLDNSPEAKARGFSIDLNLGYLQRGEDLLNIIDTPGFLEFIEELYKGIRVAETVVLVVNAEKGVEVQTEKAWELIQEFRKPSLAFINRMDLENADFFKAYEDLKNKLEGNFALLQLPIYENNKFVGVIDLIENKALYFGKPGKADIPGELTEQAASERERLAEQLAEVDDELMMAFLEGEKLEPARLRAALVKALSERVFTPVLCGSAATGACIEPFTETLFSSTPAYSDDEELELKGLELLVFDIASDPYLGRLAYVKVFGGTLNEGMELTNLNTGNKEKIKDIYRVRGASSEKIAQAAPGELVALPKLSASLGDTLAADPSAPKLKLADFPRPVYSRAIAPLTQADEEKMSAALKDLVDTKATLDVRRDDVTKETIFWGMGDTHLAIFAERLKNRYGVSVKMERPHIPYKETIQKQATGQYKHKKQTGGRGQYGEVYLRVEPLERGKEFEFIDEIKGGVIPQQFIPGVQKGVLEAMEKGVLAGYPMTDVRVAVYYGSYHPVDSSELSFKIAAAKAFQIAVQNASPVLLEPVVKLTIWTPSEFTGDIMSSLNGKRAKILGMEPEGGRDRIEAEAPLAEVQDYALELKSLTQGRATFQMEFIGYQPVTSEKLAEELLKRERRDEGEKR